MSLDVLQIGTRFRKLDQENPPLAYSSGNVVSQELNKSFLIKGGCLRLSGSIDIATNNITTAAADCPVGLIQKVEIIGDGRKPLISMSGRDLFRMAHILNGKQPELSTLSALTIGTGRTFAATIPFNFEALRMVSPVDSYLDARPYEKLELRITWASLAALASNLNSAALTAGTITVTPQIENTVEGADRILFNRIQIYDELPVTASSTNLIQNVPRAGLLAGILLRTDRTVTGQVGSSMADDLINYVSLKSDNSFLHVDRLSWSTLQRRNVYQFQIDQTATAAVGDKLAGYAYIDLTEDGLMSSALNTLDLNQLQLIYDVTVGSNNPIIRASYIFYEPLATV